jgi:hypothetical protein
MEKRPGKEVLGKLGKWKRILDGIEVSTGTDVK